mgnify:CR=1 FL=1|jgi:hypothetical protein
MASIESIMSSSKSAPKSYLGLEEERFGLALFDPVPRFADDMGFARGPFRSLVNRFELPGTGHADPLHLRRDEVPVVLGFEAVVTDRAAELDEDKKDGTGRTRGVLCALGTGAPPPRRFACPFALRSE